MCASFGLAVTVAVDQEAMYLLAVLPERLYVTR